MREEENKRSSQETSFKRFFKKRWVFPAIYIASAALILTGVLWYQSASNNATDKYDYKATDLTGKKDGQPAIEVNRAMENFVMPVKNKDAVVEGKFYDKNSSEEEQQAAIVNYNNQYFTNTGIDITVKDADTFDVVAALSGTVTKVEEDPLLGNLIVIEHDKGIVTQYQSVKEMKVEVGDSVDQGQVLAKAGVSEVNAKAGVHVHFEIRKDNMAVNPSTYLNKPLSALQEVKTVSETGDADGKTDSEKDSKKDASDEEEMDGQSPAPSEESAENGNS